MATTSQSRLSSRQKRYEDERKAQNEWKKKDVDIEKLVKAMYEESAEHLASKIDNFYLSYANREGLTRAQAEKKIKNFDVTKYADYAKTAVENRDFSEKTNEILRAYNTKQYVSRAELLKLELQLEAAKLCGEIDNLTMLEVINAARDEFIRQAGVLGNSAQFDIAGALRQIAEGDFYGATFSERIWGRNGQYDQINQTLFSALSTIYTDMDGYKRQRRQLMDKFKSTQYEANRLLKTEMARARADAQMKMYESNGFTHYIWVAEAGACPDCEALNGVAIPVDAGQKGISMFPLHPNCRCSTYGHIELEYVAGGTTLGDRTRWEDLED